MTDARSDLHRTFGYNHEALWNRPFLIRDNHAAKDD